MNHSQEEIDNVAKALIDGISTTPVDGIFKLRISKESLSPEKKAEVQAMVKMVAEKLGRNDVTILIEAKKDLN